MVTLEWAMELRSFLRSCNLHLTNQMVDSQKGPYRFDGNIFRLTVN